MTLGDIVDKEQHFSEAMGTQDPGKDDTEFYDKAKKYWSGVRPTLDGVLGGFGHISHADIIGSKDFLNSIFKSRKPPRKFRALDCGAGIGRVTKDLLAKYFEKVDLVDQNDDFVKKVTEYVGRIPQLGNLYVAGLQDFEPTEKYDVIWCQWVLVHLTDEDLVQFFKKCQLALADGGYIVIKENITSSGNRELDPVDSSVTRPLDVLKNLLEKAGLDIVFSKYQKNFPKGLYPVIMMAMRPKTPNQPLEFPLGPIDEHEVN